MKQACVILAIASTGFAFPASAAGPPQAAPEASQGGSLAALKQGIEGNVTLKCAVLQDHTLANCTVEKEDPPNRGFGAAALKLAKLFKMKPADGQPTSGANVTIPIRFRLGDMPETLRAPEP